jgi:hypothetical protein
MQTQPLERPTRTIEIVIGRAQPKTLQIVPTSAACEPSKYRRSTFQVGTIPMSAQSAIWCAWSPPSCVDA